MGYTQEELHLAEGGDLTEIEAWYMDDDTDADQRLPHRQSPNNPCSPEALRQLGVLSWRLDADAWQSDPRLQTIRAVRGYNYEEVVTISPEKLPGYEAKIKSFYEEHIHSDEEIRFVLDGRGYFDVRDGEDRWVRVACCKGDMIVLPAGIYHRFSLDEDNYAKALRLFVGEPVWTPINRPCDEQPARKSYLTQFGVAAS